MRKLVALFLMAVLLASVVYAEQGKAGAAKAQNAKTAVVINESDEDELNETDDLVNEGNETDDSVGEGNETEDNFNETDDSINKTKGRGPIQAISALNASLGKGNPSSASIEARQRVIAKLQQKITEKEQQIEQVKERLQEKAQQRSLARERVHALLELRNVTNESIGRQISSIVKEFNNSMNEAENAELKIANKNRIAKFFFGGSEEQAKIINVSVQANDAQLQKLRELQQQSDGIVAEFIAEQIRQLEQEQARLQQVAQKEEKSKGLIGWLFRR